MTENNTTHKITKTPELIEARQALTLPHESSDGEWPDEQLVEIVKSGDIMQIRTIAQMQDISLVKDNSGNTLMHVAAKYGTPEMIEELAQHNCILNEPNAIGDKPVHIATQHGRMNIINKLYELGCSINEPNEQSRKTPLHIAARYLGVEELRQLVLWGADVNATNKWGQTPLFSAMANHNKEAAMELLQMGSDIDKQDHIGNTPLFYVSMLGDTEMAELLCSRGANILIHNKENESAEDWALAENHLDIASMLHVFVLRNFLQNKLDKMDTQLTTLKNLVKDVSNEELLEKIGLRNFAGIKYSQFRATTRLTEMARFTHRVGCMAQQNNHQTTSLSQLEEALRLSLTNASLSPAAFMAATEQMLFTPQTLVDYLENMHKDLKTIQTSLQFIPDSILNTTMHINKNYPLYSISRAQARLSQISQLVGDLSKEKEKNLTQPEVQRITSASVPLAEKQKQEAIRQK